ncbi:unnamed protein product [Cylindrotheca closterium]|uniref:Uncharacterized protein n=1 Tax=Cylindrotheca closterium TaxID=2856 RepID=A0AAD2PXE1_9STRA|nr:unnamed protein product [Cylindrotheca closterium]
MTIIWPLGLLPTFILLAASTLSFNDSICVWAQFDLQDYILNAPSCSITDELDVQCDFSNIEPSDGNIASFITGFDNCQGAATRDSELSLSATNGAATSGDYSVIIDINTDFDLTNGESETFDFCLLTHLRDANSNLMIYQGQKISSTFTSNAEFTVSDINTQVFDGVGNEVDSDSKIFSVTARRCDLSRKEIASPALGVGATLFICIDTRSPNVVVAAVNGFYGRKINVPQTDLLLGNTEILGLGTDAIVIGTRPFVKFFGDTTPIEVFGTVTLDIGNNGVRSRQLVRMLQADGEENFDVEVDVEVQQEVSPAPNHSISTRTIMGALLIALIAL